MTIIGILGIVLAVIGALAVVWLIGGAVAIAYLSTNPPRRRPKRTPLEFDAAYEDVTFSSREGVVLSGWFVPAPSEANEGKPRGAVILCHGMLANREEVLPWAEPLWERGFSLMMFDFRGYGNSEGERCTGGYHETQDLLGAVDYLVSRPDMAGLPLGVFGFSMGGAAAILAAAEDNRIQAVATHGAFATLTGAVKQRCRRHYGPLGPVAEWLTLTIGRKLRWIDISVSAVSPVKAVSRLTPRPLLILHGDRDRVVRANDARALHAAAGYPKSLRVLPRSGHKRIHRQLRQAVRRRVAEFFCAKLSPNTTGAAASDKPASVPAWDRKSRHENAIRN